MSIPIQHYKAQVHLEAMKLLDFFQEELGIPPVFACLQMGGFCVSSLKAYYEMHDLTPPDEVVNFMETIYPKMLADLNSAIENQFLMINTQGTA